MRLEIKKAERLQRKFKGALSGPSGSGKTWTALELATGLAEGGKILVIDSERSSSTLYADKFDFEILDLPDNNYKTYLEAIDAGIASNFAVIIIDSLSQAWESLLEEVDKLTLKSRSRNAYTEGWSEVTPIYRKLLKKIVDAPCHVIATFRAKTDYIMKEKTDRNGKTYQAPEKVGMAPIFRQGGEYEFDVVANIDLDHNFVVEKTRIGFLDGMIEKKIDKKLGIQIVNWLNSGKKEEPIVADQNPLEYKIQTSGSMKTGQSLGQIINEDRQWVLNAQNDPRVASKLSKRDMANIRALTITSTTNSPPIPPVPPAIESLGDLPLSFTNEGEKSNGQ